MSKINYDYIFSTSGYSTPKVSTVIDFILWSSSGLSILFTLTDAILSTTSNPSKPSIPNSGVYTFKGHASIKAEPKISAPELAYYDAGNTVNYDSLIQADGHYWISYLSYSGARRYIAIN